MEDLNPGKGSSSKTKNRKKNLKGTRYFTLTEEKAFD